jgi:endonuclease VIII
MLSDGPCSPARRVDLPLLRLAGRGEIPHQIGYKEQTMPEGDTIYRAAATLRRALLGKTVTRFETSVDSVAAVDAQTPVAGRTVDTVEARGKHLLITFGDLVLHTHMRMTGSWHIYRPGEPWQKPAHQAHVTIYTDEFVAPCFTAPVVELLTARQAARHPDLTALGPDAITEEFDASEARARMRQRPEVEIGVALLNQRVMAGVGNVYKSEVLFLKRVSPFHKVGELSDETLDALIAESHRLLRLNTTGGRRRTRFGLSERDRLWVYGRSGEPCRQCGTRIQMRRQGLDARSTYYCPVCQSTG